MMKMRYLVELFRFECVAATKTMENVTFPALIGMLNRYVLNYIFSTFVNSSFVKFFGSNILLSMSFVS
ncbi:hypothetical protein PS1_008897 [Malus domestica]